MRRGVRAAVWSLGAIMLASVVGYILLVVGRGISPPILPISSSNRINGYSTGDAVLVDQADRLLRRADIAVVEVRGGTRVVIVLSTDSDVDGVAGYRVGGFADGKTESVKVDRVVGLAGTRLPLVGWPLLAARNAAGQLALAATVAAMVLILFLSRPAPAELDVDGVRRIPLPPLLAIGPGPPAQRDESTDAAPADAPVEGDVEEAPAEPGAPTSSAVSLGVIPGALGLPYLGDSMSISPDDLRQVRFAQSRRGYDTDAVDRALDAVADTLESLIAERVELIEQIKRLERESERLRGSELGLTQALNAAKAETEAIKAEATRLVSAAQGAAANTAGAAAAAAGDPAMAQLLGETRAMRSLLQSFLTQVHEQATGDPSEGRPA